MNKRTERYAATYKELRALTEVFRAYLAAVHITRTDSSMCNDLRSLPLLESEKVANRMPTYHPTELFVTVAGYEYTDGRYRRLKSMRGSSLNGGIAIRARAYFEEALKVGVPTDITTILNVQSPVLREDASWKANDNNHFIAFLIKPPAAEAGLPPKSTLAVPGVPARSELTPPTAGNRGGNTNSEGPNEIEIENEPPAQRLPPRTKWFEKRN